MAKRVQQKLSDALIRRLPRPKRPREVRDHVVRGLVLRINPLLGGGASYTWKADTFTESGKRHPTTLGTFPAMDCAAARAAARSLRDGIDAGDEAILAKEEDPTLGAFLTLWEQHNAATGKLKSAPKIARALRTAFPVELKVRAITRPMVLAWQAEHAARTSPANSNRLISYLAGVLNYACELEILEANPARIGNGTGIKKLPEHTDESRFFTEAEWQRFDAALDANAPVWFADACRVALNTGCRLGELMALEWHNVSLAQRTVTFAGRTTKTRKTRRVPLNATAYRVLKARSEHSGAAGKVFADAVPSRVTVLFDKVLEAAGVAKQDDRDRRLSFRSLRTTFGSWAYLRTRNLVGVSKLLGHSSIQVTAAHYAHLLPQDLADITAAVG